MFQGAYNLKDGKGDLVISNLTTRCITFEADTLIAQAVPLVESNSYQVNRITAEHKDFEPRQKEDIKVGNNLSEDVVDKLHTLLQEYRDCFATKLKEIGCVKDMEMHIELSDNRPIVYRKRMPFGLANAPAVFQRMINKILGNKRYEYALAYLDVVLIPAKSTNDMFERLEEILKLMSEFGLTLKFTKSRFFDIEVDYLGYEVSAEGIQPGSAKTQAVKAFPTPRNVHELRQFLGLTGYYRKFIQDYGFIAQPLSFLL